MPYLITQHDDGTISLEFEKSKPIYRNKKGKSEIVFPLDYVVIDLETTGFSAAVFSTIPAASVIVCPLSM